MLVDEEGGFVAATAGFFVALRGRSADLAEPSPVIFTRTDCEPPTGAGAGTCRLVSFAPGARQPRSTTITQESPPLLPTLS